MKEKLLFVGIGQCGNNIVDGLLSSDKQYKGLLMNTSKNDIAALSNREKAYLVPNASGCAKNRKLAVKYMKDNYTTMIDYINDKYEQQSIVYIIFSMAGGTGSGLSPFLAKMLTASNPEKTYNLICVLPRLDGIKRRMLQNTIDCWNDITKLDNVNSIMFVNNNSRQTDMEVNEDLIYELNNFFNMGKYADSRAAIDDSEVEDLARTKGFTYIYSFDTENFEDSLMKAMSESIFVNYQGDEFEKYGVSLINDYDVNETIQSLFGECNDVAHTGYNNEINVLAITGAEFHNGFMDNYICEFNDLKTSNQNRSLNKLQIKGIEKDVAIKITTKKQNVTVKNNNPIQELVEEYGTKSLDDIFDSVLKDFN